MDSLTTFFANNKEVFVWISIAIGLPSTLLYCAEVWTIFWHKPFHNSFYTLFCVRASTDLAYTFISYYIVRLPVLFPEWFLHFGWPNWALAFAAFICGYTFVSDNLSITFILANRYTAIGHAVTHKHIWRKFMVPVLLIIYGVPLYTVGILFIKLDVFAARDGQGRILSIYITDAINGTTLNTYVFTIMICTVLFLFFCIPINVAILLAYRKTQLATNQLQGITIGQQSSVSAAAKAKADLIERRLLLFAVFTFFGHVLIALHQVTLYFGYSTGNAFLTALIDSQYALVMDFGFVVLPSWLLLWASASFRQQFFAQFLPNTLYGKIYNTQMHSIKITTVVPAAKPMQQIASIPRMTH